MDKRETYLTTVSGKRFYFEDIEASEFSVADMAHALARIARYNGHLRTGNAIYSVAQHSVLVAQYVEVDHPELAMAALFHDSTEAYLGDVTGPWKKLLAPIFKPYEHRCDRAIESWLGLPAGSFDDPIVKNADLAIRKNEVNSMGHGADSLCEAGQEGYKDLEALNMGAITPWTIEQSEWQFRLHYQRYVNS